jgi:hypothetical protein
MEEHPSCGAKGAAEIIIALREELRRRGRSAAHIDVRPCACVDRCDRGPILLGLTGAVAEVAMPPYKLGDRLLEGSEIYFEYVTVDQLSAIVDQLLGFTNE